MSSMKTLFSRILLAQVATVVLALLVVTLITRASLDRGFKTFLERQEAMVLQNVAPTLTALYERRGDWTFLHDSPNAWQRIWRFSLSPGGPPENAGPNAGLNAGPNAGPNAGQRGGRGRPADAPWADEAVGPAAQLRWLRSPDRQLLRERLFLLDAAHAHVAGAAVDRWQDLPLEALTVDGEVVGWIGFRPMGNVLPPDAAGFLSGQLRITALALAVALLFAAALAWWLARTVSRPVQRLGATVARLSEGEYAARAGRHGGDEIGALARRVDALAETLERNRTARQRWIADIAHELRTPVAVLKGEIEAVADGVRRADGPMLASLGEEIDHLAGLVNDLQALALADAGALNIVKEPLRLAALIGQVAEPFRARLAERGIALDLDLDPEVALTADPQRLRQLLHNLLENSVRYVEQDGRVRLTLRDEGGPLLLLEDSGPGVQEAHIGQLFERFYRVEGSRSRATGGAGLGLAICRNIVEAHGGRITASHSALGGLAVRIELPE
jgi:two-component system sensor histidine kinase BaeS